MQQTSNFDSDAWKSQRGAAALDNRRGGMLAALEKVVVPGTPRTDVIRLLGEPDSSDAATSTDRYELGAAPYGVDEQYYEIRYRDGKVESGRLARR